MEIIMFNVVLYQPEIPPNTGNIIRLCANTNSTLHLIEPLGFCVNEKSLRRAGLDYHKYTSLYSHKSIEECIEYIGQTRWFALSTKGKSQYSDLIFHENDTFIFGPETKGLPDKILDSNFIKAVLRIPMQQDSRSLNLSNAVAIVVYEAWRQTEFI